MTRLIRIELCDECPHAVGSRSCRATTWCDEGGIIRPDGRGGLRVTIEEVEHWLAPVDAARLLQENAFAFLYDPDPAPLLRCEPRRRTGHVFPSNPAGAEVPHLLITVHPDRRYLALTAEVAAVRGGTRDICKVVSAPKGDEYATD